jgi:hypothetical protein
MIEQSKFETDAYLHPASGSSKLLLASRDPTRTGYSIGSSPAGLPPGWEVADTSGTIGATRPTADTRPIDWESRSGLSFVNYRKTLEYQQAFFDRNHFLFAAVSNCANDCIGKLYRVWRAISSLKAREEIRLERSVTINSSPWPLTLLTPGIDPNHRKNADSSPCDQYGHSGPCGIANDAIIFSI